MDDRLNQRRKVLRAAGAAAMLAAPSWAWSQGAYPNRPIKILVPFPPGNTIDIMARMLQIPMAASLGQSIVVENIGGAGGRIGTAAIVRANPDGYTIGAGQSGTLWVQPHTTKDPSYDVTKDLTRIALTVRNFNVLVRNNNTPFNNLAEMIAWSRSNPGKLTYGSNGEGGFPHLWFEEMAKLAGIKFTYVPYKGAAQVATDLISGQIMVAGDGVSAMVPYINNNQMKLLAVTNEARVSQFPDAPAIAESLPGFAANGDFGYVGPAKMQPEHVRVLNKAINDAIMSSEGQARLPG
ncbi:MAG: tripartite tricarboxylate transporter substrate binding protein [Alphaproteobacteria bacterium]|nr:tripartite tricarboxylate transporter substrate binding protein [Alphaproteobacteria bacterium]